MTLSRIGHADVPRSDNIFQSGFWARFKEACGVETHCFTLDGDESQGSLVALVRTAPSGDRYAYVPRGPQAPFGEGECGRFLEELSIALAAELPADLVCVRYDTEIPSPFTGSEHWTASGQWKGAPRADLRELRMNFGTETHKLRKAPVDHLCPDTVIVDLRGTEEENLARMRQTTRNCVRRAYRSGVEYRVRGVGWLDDWYRLYADTARRKGFYFEEISYFRRLFELARLETESRVEVGVQPEAGDGTGVGLDLFMISAMKDGLPLAGLVLGVMGRRGYYLYAGSSPERRECMPNYGLQWEAIKALRERGCLDYDLMGVPPNGDPNHSMYGLYTFKTGLGGRIVHYSGCWDYPLDDDRYVCMRNSDALQSLQY